MAFHNHRHVRILLEEEGGVVEYGIGFGPEDGGVDVKEHQAGHDAVEVFLLLLDDFADVDGVHLLDGYRIHAVNLYGNIFGAVYILGFHTHRLTLAGPVIHDAHRGA